MTYINKLIDDENFYLKLKRPYTGTDELIVYSILLMLMYAYVYNKYLYRLSFELYLAVRINIVKK